MHIRKPEQPPNHRIPAPLSGQGCALALSSLRYVKETLAHALQQWLDVILDYDFAIKHRPGVLHVLPEAGRCQLDDDVPEREPHVHSG